MDRDLAEAAIEYARDLGAGYVEARMERVSGQDSLLKNGNPEIAGFDRDAGMAIRTLVDGALGFASTNKLETDSVKAAVGKAVKMARASSRVVRNKIIPIPIPIPIPGPPRASGSQARRVE